MPKRKLSDGQEPYQSVNWAYTVNNYTGEELAHIKSLAVAGGPLKRIRQQLEIAPSTGTPHVQGVLCLKQKITRAALQKMMVPSRPTYFSCKPCYASVASNWDYCSKEGGTDPFEWSNGEDVQDTAKLDADGRAAVLLDLAEAGDWKTLRAEHQAAWLYQKRALVNARAAVLKVVDVLDGVLDNYWIYGAAGTGKDVYARTMAPHAYTKSANTKWWCNYDGQEDVILRDLGKSVVNVWDDFKLWTDRYKFNGEWKGAGFEIRPRRVIVTSNKSPKDLANDLGLDAVEYGAFLRRFQVIEILKNGDCRRYARVNIDKPPVFREIQLTHGFGEEDPLEGQYEGDAPSPPMRSSGGSRYLM